MKQTLITRLILGAFAGLTAVGAYAGQIQSSSTTIAREIITTNTQTITAPSSAYRFAGDLDARAQDQIFQVQFILTAGSWSTAPTANAISITDSVTGLPASQGAGADYQVLTSSISTDKKTLFVTLQVFNATGIQLIRQPLITVNTSTNNIAGVTTDVSAARGKLTDLYTVVGDIVTDFTASGICSANKTIGISFKHFTALTSPTSIAVAGTNGSEDESLRSSATNALNGWLVFPTNLLVNFAKPASANAKLTTGGNLTFSPTTAAPVYASGNEYISASLAYLGKVYLTQPSTGYDGDLTNVYALAGVAGGAYVNGLDAKTTATANIGDVEVGSVTVKVTASNGFVQGGTLYLSSLGGATDCDTAIAGTSTPLLGVTAANSSVTLTVPTASVNAAFGAAGTNALAVCYQNPGTVSIPSSSFSAVGTIVKSVAGSPFNEQNNVCSGTLASLGGAIKIDVRNYASSAEASGWQSVIRLINPSDSMPADVWGQLINQDGTLGNYAKLTTLPVRGIQNFTAAQIDTLLAAGSAATAAPGTAAPVAVGYGTTAAPTSRAGAPRLRITSTSGNTLRVQNYLFNTATGQIVEGSGAEAVDFAGSTDRAPESEGQYQVQDAQSGLNLQ